MNKYEFTQNCRDNNALGLISDIECMRMVVDKWTEENGGRMDESELAELAEYLEEIGWYWMAHKVNLLARALEEAKKSAQE